MSRIGKTIIDIVDGTRIEISEANAVVIGPKGTMTVPIPKQVKVVQEGNNIKVDIEGASRSDNALYGFVRSALFNAVVGVSKGWTKTLELSGVGYRAALTGNNLVLTVGFTHPVTISPPAGITFSINEGKITVSGIDKQLVGQIASDIRSVKKPEPYKGKGIKYTGEYIRRKAGKTAKTVGAAK